VVTAVAVFAVGSALFSASTGILLGMLAGGLVGMLPGTATPQAVEGQP